MGNYEEVEGAPGLPRFRWSLSPSDAIKIDRSETGNFVTSIGVGIVWADRQQPQKAIDPVITKITTALKTEFDPSGRLNPGRHI